MNSVADIGTPVGLQKEVLTIESNCLTLPSVNLTFIIFLGGVSQTQGSFSHTMHNGSGSLEQLQEASPHLSQTFFVRVFGSTGSIGSPSQDGSLKCSCALTKSNTVK